MFEKLIHPNTLNALLYAIVNHSYSHYHEDAQLDTTVTRG